MAGYGEYTIGHPTLDPTVAERRKRRSKTWGLSTRKLQQTDATPQPVAELKPIANVRREARHRRFTSTDAMIASLRQQLK